jgi:hypothetical protein
VVVFLSEVFINNSAMSEKELYSKILKGVFMIPETVSNEAKNLIQKILIVNPMSRIDAQTVY